MKYVVILGDGMADLPIEELRNKTPLQYSNIENINALASNSIIGLVKTIPDGFVAGSDTGNLSIMGYNPVKYYTGRSPLEAVSIGVDLLSTDIVFRANFVTLSDENTFENKTMVDYASSDITSAESEVLINYINEHLATSSMKYYLGDMYRNILIWSSGPKDGFKLQPPHDIVGQEIKDYLPIEPTKDTLLNIMKKSYDLLKNHPININRIKNGLNPANAIWIWGEGTKPNLESFENKYKLKGSVISAIDLVKGIGKCAGLKVEHVENVTANINTNFDGKAKKAIESLQNGSDFVYIHIDAPDDSSHKKRVYEKIESIELIDKKIVKYIKSKLDELGEDYKIMIATDHETFLSTSYHGRGLVPFLIYESNTTLNNNLKYCEEDARKTNIYFDNGEKLMDYFINGNELLYKSTRGKSKLVTASEAILKGLPEDGGLYIPSKLPKMNFSLDELKNKDYKEIAYLVMKEFLTDFTEEELKGCIENAYDEKFTHNEIAPLVKVGDEYILELFHGPTIAFKDMALTILPHLLKTSAKKQNLDKEIVILTATSGDTGKAALEGFTNIPSVKIIVFYPEDGVSEVQKRQMITHSGNNTYVFGIKGNFDDAQSAVKEIFNDKNMIDHLYERGALFSSANSINVGRLTPQIAYYFFAYSQMISKYNLKPSEPINVVVPTGNFGNILAAYFAKAMGLPINKLICASNENKVLYDFFNNKVYDKNREFILTNSPSMDILISSNLERLLYLLMNENSEKVSNYMNDLKINGSYNMEQFDENIFNSFIGKFTTEEETLNSIKTLFDKTGYLMDTHTAVAYNAYTQYINESSDTTKTVIVSTASPFKFSKSVMNALDSKYNSIDDFKLIYEMSSKCNLSIPNAIKDIDKKDVVHTKICNKNEIKDIIKNLFN